MSDNTLGGLRKGGNDLGRLGARTGRCRFAIDSPLEEAVTSELVSERKFPASWENTGNFIESGAQLHISSAKTRANSKVYEPIPYAPEQGIYFALSGN
jgi:hypothetical protein